MGADKTPSPLIRFSTLRIGGVGFFSCYIELWFSEGAHVLEKPMFGCMFEEVSLHFMSSMFGIEASNVFERDNASRDSNKGKESHPDEGGGGEKLSAATTYHNFNPVFPRHA